MTSSSGIRVAIAGMLALAIAMGVGRFALTPVLPMMQKDVALSVVAGGWLAAANYVGYLIGAMSAMAPRVRAVTAIRIGLLAIGTSTLAMGVAQDFTAWLILRLLAGAANAWVAVFAFAWCLQELATLRRSRLNGLVFAGVGAGIAVVGVICAVMMRTAVSSSQVWIVLGVLSLAGSAVVWIALGRKTDAAPSAAANPLKYCMQWSGASLRLMFCFGATGFGYIIPATFLPVMARQVMDNPAVFGWSWPIFGLAAMVSTLIAAALPGRAGNRRIWFASQLIMAFGVVLPAIWPGIVAIVAAALCVGGTFMVITMVSMQEARAVGGLYATGLIAAMTASFALGQIAGPLCVSYVVGAGGSLSAVLLFAAALLAVSACALWPGFTDASPAKTD